MTDQQQHTTTVEPSTGDGRQMWQASCSCGARSIRFPLDEQAAAWGEVHASEMARMRREWGSR
jgi:hypothetical protein